MKQNIKFLIVAIALLFSYSTNATEWQDNPAIKAMFAKARVQGTFVLFDVTEDKFIGFDHSRAETRFMPASTFKIPNSLIGLSVGAVKGVDDIVFHYDGKPRWKKEWEKDMGLREAYRLSCLPCYQEMARLVGFERMKAGVSKLGYGNGDIGSIVDNSWVEEPFWVEGPLKISAVEQTQFLKRLAQGTLPFPKKMQEDVRDIARFDQGDGWVLYAKTGWTGRDKKDKPGIGWWVGWVQKGSRLYTFALNINMSVLEDGAKRIDLARASLKELGLIDR